MSIEIKVPAMGESVTEATVARWFKKEGESVARDEPLLELETDKVTVEVPSPADGALESISVKDGDTVQVGALLGAIKEGAAGAAAAVVAKNPQAAEPKPAPAAAPAPKPAPAPAPTPAAAPTAPAPVLPGPRPRADREERGAMCRLRKTSALSLKESQNTAAQLTTFIEVDMS